MIRRPLLRCHGGKWRIALWIISRFPPRRVYNDLDSDIVNLFRVARDQGAELRRELALTPIRFFYRGEANNV
ncbi:MAG: hypothetical protein LBK73_16750 [Treponema sp.]|jgi:DNA adenine methylase|nr:hypothetical protein [Treponema sp.]